MPNGTRKIGLLIALYTAQGLPYGLFTQLLPIAMVDAGYSLKAISATTLLSLPWAFKFLWAPYLDHIGTRRHWLLTLQWLTIATALLLTQLDFSTGFTLALMAAFTIGVFSASQDVVTDGLAVRMLDLHERGPANGVQVGAYRFGMILGGGLLLWVFARSNWSTTFLCLAGLMALTTVPVFFLQEAPRARTDPGPKAQRLLLGWLQRLLAPGMLGFAALILCYRFGDAMVSPLMGPFMRKAGLSIESLALLRGTVGSVTSLLGALVGGWFTFRVGRRRALLWSGVLQAACFVLFAIAAAGRGGVELLWIATIVEGVISTMATVALFTLMMDACDPQHAGTDYTLFACVFVLVTNLGFFSGSAVGDAAGFVATFTTGTVVALVGCLVTVWLLDRKPIPQRVALAWP